MPTRNVVITDHQAALVERLVAEGRYQNASEVLRDGLRLVEEREQDDAAKLEGLAGGAWSRSVSRMTPRSWSGCGAPPCGAMPTSTPGGSSRCQAGTA